MRLLFLSNLYPPCDLGGFEQLCQEMAVRLRQRGHQVHILTSGFGAERGLPPEPEVSRSLSLEADVFHYRPLDFFLKRPAQERANARHLQQAIASFAPDRLVVWGMWNLSQNLAAQAEQWLPGRVAYYLASYWPNDVDVHRQYWELPAGRPWAERLKRIGRGLALGQLRREGYPPPLRFDQVACCSRYVREVLVSAKRLPASADVFYVGIDPAPFVSGQAARAAAPAGAGLQLVYFGSLLPQKGVHTAVEALGRLKAQGRLDKMQLTLLGGGHPDYMAHLQTLAQQLGVAEQVQFVGRVPREEIPARLAAYDVFLFTSVWPEPMARTVMEAMAAGLLVIGSEVGGQVEMLTHEQNALTFPAEDAERLAQHLIRIQQEPELRQRLAQAGQQLVLKEFTLERMARDFDNWLGPRVK